MVVEDLHWADEATLDWLTYLARRVSGRRALVVTSFRDDGLNGNEALRLVVGQIATQRATSRIALPPLSVAAVRHLTEGSPGSGEELHRLTGGNPFYVGEVLGAGLDVVPQTVADAVRARTGLLSGASRAVLEAAAVLARPVPSDTLEHVAGMPGEAVDECLASGALVDDGDGIRFRHELARMAVERDMPERRSVRLHAAALEALQVLPGPPALAELAHHAEAAGDAEAAVRFAAEAAARAAAMGANREAAVQFRRALRFVDLDDERAALLEGLTGALSRMDQWEEATLHCEEALALRRRAGETQSISRLLRVYQRCLWRLCRGEDAALVAKELFALMSEAPDSREKGWAYASFACLDEVEPSRSLAFAAEALRLADRYDDPELAAHALNTRGCLQAELGGEGWTDLTESIRMATTHRFDEAAARGYANLYQIAVDSARFAEYEWCFLEGMEFCRDNDMHTYSLCIRGSRAEALLKMGRLAAVDKESLTAMAEPTSPINRLHLLIPLAVSRVRQGHDDADRLLGEALSLAEETGDTYWQLQVLSGYAQLAWLAGTSTPLADRMLAMLTGPGHADAVAVAELSVWVDRLGLPTGTRERTPAPYDLSLRGEHEAAAVAWSRLACPFEEAAALVCAGGSVNLRRALEIFTVLGSAPAAALVRRRLTESGEKAVPRGPRPATRNHPCGLTPREADVLELLRAGLSNADISRRLFISERTAHHHVSAILSKLGVSSRGEASREADRLGLPG